ncbi:alkaline-phosphatase-like protein [Xylariaceae sp. FL0804]|nr:alkaline-phosphatase-like protein [Xylariaceae sp. FL0804]
MKRPNFLIIVADDLGYSDIGPYGGEIKTPNLDKLAKDGIRMTNFHTASTCSPTRAMLFSGTDHHIAGLGQMAEYMRAFPDYFKDKEGYEGYLNWKVAAMSEILSDADYLTIMSGKWHLGLTKELAPCSRGFQKSFSFLPGSGNHHAWEPQLEDDEFRMPVMKTEAFWMDGDKYIDMKKDLPEDFYSTRSFTDRMLKFLEERDAQEKEKPFFAYLPFTAPHWPLQAPRERVQKYAGVYDDGPDALTEKRLKRLQELGLVPEGVEHAPPVGNLGPEWKDLSDAERAESARKMETFAAMVDIIDENIGRVTDYLESTGELDNTFVLFMSDNGAEGVAMEAMPVMGGPTMMDAIINKHYDNSFDNIGQPTSFIWYGARWACAATAPSRGCKTWILEGGIRCPCVVRYPGFGTGTAAAAAAAGQGEGGGAVTRAFTTVMDVLPTVLELAGVAHPTAAAGGGGGGKDKEGGGSGGGLFRGRTVAAPRGRSWATHLRAVMGSSGRGPGPGSPEEGAVEESSVHGEETHVHGWELFGQRAMREGPWKIVWMPSPRGRDAWELYHVERDPAELHDLAGAEPEVLARLLRHWEVYFAETGMVEYPGASARAGTQVS